MALTRVWIPSPNYSSRTTAVRLIVLHTAEGALTIESLGSFFSNPASGVSSHVGIDDTKNTVGEYVKPNRKAWTQGNANGYAVAAEQCAFAAWSTAEWHNHPNMLANTAAWIAEEAARFGIPIKKLTASQAQDGHSKGVCQHIDLGSAGGGHVDCDYGTGNYPIDEVIEMAKGGGEIPLAPATEEGDDVFIRSSDKRVRWAIYDGQRTYWRLIPQGCEQNISARIIEDPNDTWLNLWDH